MNRGEWQRDLAMLGALALAVLGFFWRAALLQGTFFVQDVMVQNYPFREFFSRALKQFSLPLWNPQINCGFPLFAEGQAGALYPFNLLAALLLPTYAALNYNLLFHFWLAGAGAYAFLRAIGCLRPAALVGGLTYGCSGYLVVRAMSPNYIDVCAWMPFSFLMVELALQRGSWLYLWGGALVAGLQMLAGHPQAALYSAGAGSLYALYRGWGQGWKFLAVAVAGVPLLGLGLAAVQLLPTVELVRVSARSEGVSLAQFVAMSLPPERLITFLLPNFFGNDAAGSYWGQRDGFFIQLCPYLGVVPLVLALVALRRRRDRYTGFFCALGLLALVLALGRFTPIFEFLYAFPGLKFFRIPTRFLLWLGFAIAVLAGLGLDQVLARRPQGQRGIWWACGLLALLAAGMACLNYQVLLANVAELRQLGGERFAGLLHYQGELRLDLARCLLMLGVGAGVAASQGGGVRQLRAIAWAVPLSVYADLYSFGRDFNGLVEPQVYLQQPATAARILQDAQSPGGMAPRTLSLIAENNSPYDWHSGWATDQTSYRKYPQTLRMYTGSIYGLGDALPGWSPLHLARHWEFMRGYPEFMDLAGVDYVLSYRPLSRPGLQLLFDGEVKVYRNQNALPRAYLVPGFQVVEESDQRLRYLKSPGFDPRQQVVLETLPDWRPSGQAAPSEARILAYGPEEVQIELGAHQGGILVLSDTCYPGWHAYVDGQEHPILQANHVFRAVAVDAAARTVVFRYQPASFTAGVWLSLGALFCLAGLGWWSRNCSLEDQAIATATGGKTKLWTLQIALILLLYALVRQWPAWAEGLERSRVLSAWGG